MRDRKGWKALGYESFDAYGKAELGYERSHLYELASAAEVEKSLISVRNCAQNNIPVQYPIGYKTAFPTAAGSLGLRRIVRGSRSAIADKTTFLKECQNYWIQIRNALRISIQFVPPSPFYPRQPGGCPRGPRRSRAE